MNLKVSSLECRDDEDVLDLDEDLEDDASKEMFAAVVHSMALSGQNLVQSQEYKDLTSRGFFITSITWRSEYEREPNDIVQFDAGFEDRKQEQASSIKCSRHFVRTKVRTEKLLSMYLTWKEQSSFQFWKMRQERFYPTF